MTFSFRSLNCNRNRIRPRNVESTKLSNLYTQTTRRVPVLHFQWKRFTVFLATSDALRNGYFPATRHSRSSKEIKVKMAKIVGRDTPAGPSITAWYYQEKRVASSLQRIVSDAIHFSRRNVCRCAMVANVASLFPEGN